MAGGETALEQLTQLNLAARRGQGVEVHVMNMDVALAMRLRELRRDDGHLVELLGGLRAVLQHGAHGRVGVDVRVLALHVGIRRLGERDVLERLENAAVDVAHAAALGAVQDIGFCRLGKSCLDERLFYQILHALDRRSALDSAFFNLFDHSTRNLVGNRTALHGAGSGEGALDRGSNLRLVERNGATIALDNAGNRLRVLHEFLFSLAATAQAATPVCPAAPQAALSVFWPSGRTLLCSAPKWKQAE